MIIEKRLTDIHRIIKEKRIITHFQPLVSAKKKSMLGIEALSRGMDVLSKEIIPPCSLFKDAATHNLTLELDRLCRQIALDSFSNIFHDNRNLLLFLNLNTGIIKNSIVGSGHIINLVNSYQLNPNNIVLEIIESEANDIEALQRFIDLYRSYGFLIALDDVGSGHSNLDRVFMTKPDIIKIDKLLIRDIDKHFYKQEICKALISLSQRIGALVVAEGVETEEEVITCLELGIDLLQGFYFLRPQATNTFSVNCLDSKINYITAKFKDYKLQYLKKEIAQRKFYEGIVIRTLDFLSKTTLDDFDDKLLTLVNYYPSIECIYILDSEGVQVSKTICNYADRPRSKNIIYYPAKKGTDHSFKDYYYLLVNSENKFIFSEPYISLASGNLTVTASSQFFDFCGAPYILCMDFLYNPE